MIQIYHAPRRQGKTTQALQMLRDNPKAVLICHVGSRVAQLNQENKDLEPRVFSAYCCKSKFTGMNYDEVIIDDGDCIQLSLLLDLINFFQGRNVKITITTTM